MHPGGHHRAHGLAAEGRRKVLSGASRRQAPCAVPWERCSADRSRPAGWTRYHARRWWRHVTHISVAGSITPVGTLVKAAKQLAGEVTPSGTTRKDVAVPWPAPSVPTGSLRKGVGSSLGGLMAPLGNLLTQLGGPGVSVPGEVAVTVSSPAVVNAELELASGVQTTVTSPAAASLDVSEA